MIIFQDVPAPPELAYYVKGFWVVESDGTTEFIHHGVAIDFATMIFDYNMGQNEFTDADGVKYPTANVHGQTKKFRSFRTNLPFGMFGICLYPYVMPLLFGKPADSISDRVISLDRLAGKDAILLEQRIQVANGTDERVKLFTDCFKERIEASGNKDLNICEAVRKVIHLQHEGPVTELASHFNLSTRQFERRFKEHAGFGPKLFGRIARFQKAYALCGEENPSLLDIAHTCGYYDQAHFNRDFKMFSGLLPGEIINEKNKRNAEINLGKNGFSISKDQEMSPFYKGKRLS